MIVGPEIEIIQRDNLPSPEQIGQLATLLVEFAERHERLSSHGNQSRGENRRYVIQPMQQFEVSSLDLPDVYLLQSRTAAHLEVAASGASRLKVFDSLVRKEFGLPGGHGVRSRYDFSWTEDKTIDARRCMMAIPSSAVVEPMIDIVDRMVTTKRSPFRDDDAVVAYMTYEVDQMTADDTDYVAASIDSLICDIDAGRRAYRESDAEHSGFIVRH